MNFESIKISEKQRRKYDDEIIRLNKLLDEVMMENLILKSQGVHIGSNSTFKLNRSSQFRSKWGKRFRTLKHSYTTYGIQETTKKIKNKIIRKIRRKHGK